MSAPVTSHHDQQRHQIKESVSHALVLEFLYFELLLVMSGFSLCTADDPVFPKVRRILVYEDQERSNYLNTLSMSH